MYTITSVGIYGGVYAESTEVRSAADVGLGSMLGLHTHKDFTGVGLTQPARAVWGSSERVRRVDVMRGKIMMTSRK